MLAYLGSETYSELCLFENIVLQAFQQNLKRLMFFDYNDISLNARLSLLK